MAHARKTIRDAIVDAVAGPATDNINVFKSRTHPVIDADLPCLLVYFISEESGQRTMGPVRAVQRMATFRIEIVASADADLDDVFDDIAAQIEAAMGADRTLGGTAKTSQLVSTDTVLRGVAEGQGERLLGSAKLAWQVEYWTTDADPTATI